MTLAVKQCWHVFINRVERAGSKDYLIIATTTESGDDAIVSEAQRFGVLIYRVSENDVLDRYYHAALEYKLDVVVRITSDCPLIEPEVIDKIVKEFLDARPPFDYASNVLERTYPRGLDTEVIWLKVLERGKREISTRACYTIYSQKS